MAMAACGDDDNSSTAPTTSATTAAGATTVPAGAPTRPGGSAGGSAGATPTAAGGTPADLDSNAVLKLPLDMTTFGTGFDPPRANAPGQFWNELIYGTLLRRTGDGAYHDELAKLSGTKIVD